MTPSTGAQLRRSRLALPHLSWPRPRFWLITAGVAVALVGITVTALLTLPFFRIRHVQVVGERQVTQDQVLQLAAVPTNTPMIRLGVDEIGARVATLAAVAHVKVVRVWPDTVRIEVDERRPVAYTALAGGGYGLIDVHGAIYRAIETAPDGLPQVTGNGTGAAGGPAAGAPDPSTAAAVDVARRLPAGLARRVTTVWAAGPEDVRLQLRDASQVRWGGPTRSAQKARVLLLLLRHHPAAVYDVSAPQAPATSP